MAPVSLSFCGLVHCQSQRMEKTPSATVCPPELTAPQLCTEGPAAALSPLRVYVRSYWPAAWEVYPSISVAGM